MRRRFYGMTSAIQFRSRAEIDRNEWNAFVDGNDEAWLWHRSEFIDARSLWSATSDVSFGVLDARNVLLAVVPLYIMLGFRYAPTHSETPKWLLCNGGPAVTGAQRPNLRRKVMATLAAHLPELIEKHNARYLEAWIPAQTPFLHGPAAPRANPLYHLGFENTSGATWMIDLAPMVEEIRRRYSETTRRFLKKAGRGPFTLREAAGSRDLKTYYDLHLETIRRLGSEPEPFEFFQTIFERMLPQKFARIVFFEQGGRVTAANNTAIYKHGAYYWTGASLTEKHDYEGRVLFDDQIVHARKSGCMQFEAGQAYVSGEYAPLIRGTSDFKRSFGSELVTWHRGRIRAAESKPQVTAESKPQATALRRLLFRVMGR
jgi:Acetyltransferase (GNAT) domain